MSYTHYSV